MMNNLHCPIDTQALTVLRLLILIRLLIQTRRGRTMQQILERLKDFRLPVSHRQLQRDLAALSGPLGLESRRLDHEETDAHYWRSTDPDAWRRMFLPAGLGSTNQGPDPLNLDTETSRPIVVEERPTRIYQRAFRILLIVELLPSDLDETWENAKAIRAELLDRGVVVTDRTVLRDLAFIRRHFLIFMETGRSRRQLWQKVGDGDWLDAFEPRLPEPASTTEPAANAFLYGTDPIAGKVH